jgi:hypothetical protein
MATVPPVDLTTQNQNAQRASQDTTDQANNDAALRAEENAVQNQTISRNQENTQNDNTRQTDNNLDLDQARRIADENSANVQRESLQRATNPPSSEVSDFQASLNQA